MDRLSSLRNRIEHAADRLRSRLWFIPTASTLAAIATAELILWIDRRLESTIGGLPFGGGPDAARSVLGTIATAMITLAALAFSITIVVLQLASSQFSPRALRTFLRDRQSKLAVGVFVAVFVFALVVLRDVRSPLEGVREAFVPGLAITLAFVGALTGVAVFIYYINHIAQSMRVASLIRAVSEETHGTIARMEQSGDRRPFSPVEIGDASLVVLSPRSGILVGFESASLVRFAHERGWALRLVPAVGDFVARRAPLFEVYGPPGDPGNPTRFVGFGDERTMRQDPAFGFRQLVDIAQRALSPGVNDPTTAVQVLDSIHDLLRRVAPLPLPTGHYVDEEGALRLLVPTMSWEDLLSLAVSEIRHYGEGSVQVARRLRALLEDIRQVALPERRPAIDRELQLLAAMVERGFPDLHDRSAADQADQQGLGS